jgi:hypothetical protein
MDLGNSYPFNLIQGSWSINIKDEASILHGKKRLKSFFYDYAFPWFNRFDTVESISERLLRYSHKSKIQDGMGHLEKAFVVALLRNDRELLHRVIAKYIASGSGYQQQAREFYSKAQTAYPDFFTPNLLELPK